MSSLAITTSFSLPNQTSQFNDDSALVPSPVTSRPSFGLDFEDLIMLKKVGKSKTIVFMAYSRSLRQNFAVKLFPYRQKKICSNFLNEIKFDFLVHPNIISVLSYSHKETMKLQNNSTLDVSFVLMELAPNGDFYSLLITKKISFDSKLARTYFHQLIEALEYMHSQSVAHCDLKLENLLLGNDYQLKVADFDTATTETQSPKRIHGTFNYRAPEIAEGKCQDFKAADIYSAGVLLFMFKSGGILPHLEDKLFNDVNLLDLLNNNNQLFWEKHSEIQNKSLEFFEEDFRELVNGMTKSEPNERMTIGQIKESNWYQGETYSNEELIMIMKKKQNC